MISAEQIIQAIEDRAKDRWGDRWLPSLARAYCELLDVGYNSRRRQVYAVFERRSCTLDTAIALAAAVDCKFQLTCEVNLL